MLLFLSVAAQTQAKEPSRKESRELETRLKEQGKIQEIKIPKSEIDGIQSELLNYESLLTELDKILEETVDAALAEQRKSLSLAFENKASRLLKSRIFWRRAAVGELFVILGSMLGVAALNMLAE